MVSQGIRTSELWLSVFGICLCVIDSIYGEGHAVVQIGIIVTAYTAARGVKKFKYGEHIKPDNKE